MSFVVRAVAGGMRAERVGKINVRRGHEVQKIVAEAHELRPGESPEASVCATQRRREPAAVCAPRRAPPE